MIIVKKEKCAGCGLCARICHEHCIGITNGNGSKVAQVDQVLCSTCTQCIAICPNQALSWDHVPSVSFKTDRLPSARQLEECLKQRRTVRIFKNTRIEPALIKEIVSISIYAPTNNYDLRAIVVDDPAIIAGFDAIIMQFVTSLYNLVFKPRRLFNLLKMIIPAVNLKQKVKLARSLESGHAFETQPAAMVFVIGDPRIILSEASAHYALYNMILYAQAKGIGSRIQSAGPLTLDRSRAARKCLGLGKHEHILGTLDLGYPAVRFRNKVEGKSMPIQWNEG